MAHPNYGNCGRWLCGYGYFGDHGRDANFPMNEVVVEDDEGWGAMMGKDFGCSLFEPR
jgi:hypothetical protein